MKFGWRLPSPACPNVATLMSYRLPIASIARSRSGTRLRGTPTSSIRTIPCRSSARSARRRACRSQSASVASAARIVVVDPAASQAATAASSSADAAGSGRSDSTRSMASASRSRPRLNASSTAAIEALSSSSNVTMSMPAATIRATASPAPSRVGKNASIVVRGGGATRSRSVASVMIPSVPCDPTNRCVRA